MGLIKDSIKEKEYKSCYLIYGEEAYLRNYYKNALKTQLVNEGDNLNYSYFEGAGTNIQEVISLTETMPFMAEYRVIIVENSGWFSKASGDSSGDEEASGSGKFGSLCDAIKIMPENVIIIFSEEKVDKRSKLFKAVTKEGLSEEFSSQTDEQLARWCINYLKSFGKTIKPNAAFYFVTEVGLDMMLLMNELDKIIAYCLDKEEITIEDIDEVTTHQINGKIFDMISFISAHKQKEALNLYYDLLKLRESPFHILSLLVRQYNQMLEIKDGLNRGYSTQKIADKTGQKEWIVKKIKDTVARVSVKEIKTCLEACAKADEDIKSGNLTDLMSVEILIISCSS